MDVDEIIRLVSLKLASWDLFRGSTKIISQDFLLRGGHKSYEIIEQFLGIVLVYDYPVLQVRLIFKYLWY